MNTVEVALMLVRVWLGVVMLMHGVNHVRNVEGTTRWFAGLGFRSASLHARLSGYGEVLMGLALITGTLTAVAAAGVVATMVIAFVSNHRNAGFYVFNRPTEGWEYVATLTVIALALAIAGPGGAAIDHVLGLHEALDGADGLVVILAGVIVAALILAATWRPPERSDAT